MIDAVLLFGLMNVLFEFVLLSMLKPRIRLRVLGNSNATAIIHVVFLFLNLAIHWGTLIGTMSAVLAFISSIVTVKFARVMFGYIESGHLYHTGLIRYASKEIA